MRAGRLMGTLTMVSMYSVSLVPPVYAAEENRQLVDFSIKQNSLAEALLIFARVTGEQIIFPYDITSNYTAAPLSGKLATNEALSILLQDTPFRAYRNPDNTIIIRFDKERARELRLKQEKLERERRREARNIALDSMVRSLDEQKPAVEKKLLEELVITGSQLKRRELTTANPLSIVDAEMISTTGTVNVENALNRYPQVIPGLTAHSNNPGNGTVTVDLRGLGPVRTLVLVNGRRYAPSDEDGVVDLNAIPTILLEQVEIVTGGTSAVYGSDAISGVVNFVLKDDFNGFLVDAQQKVSSQGDADKANWDMVYGQEIGQGRGNFFFHIGYLERESLLQESRDFSTFALTDYYIEPGSVDEKYGFGIPLSPDEGGIPGLVRSGSSAIPDTLIYDVSGSGPYPGLSTFTPEGEIKTYDRLTDAYNYAPANYLQVPQKRWMITFGGDYDLSESANVYLQSIYVHNRVDTELAPTPAFIGDVTVPVENPFLSDQAKLALQGIDWYGTGTLMQARDSMGALLFDLNGNPVQARQALSLVYDGQGNVVGSEPLWNDDGTPVAVVGVPDEMTSGRLLFESDGKALIPFLARRFVEIGPRRQENDRDTFNVVLGTDIKFSDHLSLLAHYNFSNYSHNEFSVNDISSTRLRHALDIEMVNGKYVCADEAARDDGCFPVNIFGQGNVTGAAADYISIDVLSKTKYQRHVASLALSGNIAKAPLEDMKYLIGVDWRRESLRRSIDDYLSSDDSLGFNQSQNLSGAYDVVSLFGEFSIPLLAQMSGGQQLEVSGAFRFSEFSTSSSAVSFAGGIFWKPTKNLSFRGQFQRAVRAPSISELYTATYENFLPASDPCADSFYDVYGDIDTLCETTGVPIGQTGKFSPVSSQVRSVYGGNPNLEEEHSNTFTLGAVFEPDFIENFQVTLDYYNINIYDMIDVLAGGTSNVLELCYSGSDPNNPYCNAIHRLDGGNIDYVEAQLTNQGKAKTSGLDAQMFFYTELGGGLMSNNDSLDIYFQGSFVFDYKLQAANGLVGYDCAGYFGLHCGDPHPRFRFTQMTTWNTGPMSLTVRWRYLSGVRTGSQLSGIDPADLAVPALSAEHYFDLYLKYHIGENVTLRGGVDNLFNNQPTPVGESQQQANTFPNFYDVLGPYMYFGVEARF
ncbi:TonB-dependent receptor [Emcibacter nanhaiensis]|uniref:TonB-dependent receptor n=1 Tax=Emcibacter nanhaiensis TaxID=1505037 RepID=A0A501PRT3_9PROT|nr:TonB-dependent receptor [Emcibacter nanhaiensis]TPD63153.1 TonB-dependent receptor [Emcibacter nanhaiensis]